MSKKEIVAMILAGGQGSRLKDLTKNLCKPAVPFGGKYRIIDFTLSNCTHSGIDTVGVLTQYKPFSLNTHIGIGSPWDLDRKYGGIHLLPPFMKESGGNWYKGTADAIYQNMSFIEYYEPEYVVVLSGDHIYKMDYSKIIEFHKEKEADATIAVIEVPMLDASRFGILNVYEDNSVYEFEEKPENPKSNLASMGIYVFTWKTIKKFLIKDNKDEGSSNDFGKNIIPKMILEQQKVFAYPFKGYWKDVGTIKSYWEANMDLLKEDCGLNLYEKHWKIYSQSTVSPPQYIGNAGKIENSMVSDGCVVFGDVINSILFPNVYVDKSAKIIDSVIMSNVKIGKNVIIDKAVIGSDTIIRRNTVIGNSRDITLIGEQQEVKTNYVINS